MGLCWGGLEWAWGRSTMDSWHPGRGGPNWTWPSQPPPLNPSPRPTRTPPTRTLLPTASPLTQPKDAIQGHVLSYVKQRGHGQLVGQTQSRPKIEAVT